MSSFTEPLTVTKLQNGKWRVSRLFRYYFSDDMIGDFIEIPEGFETDFASVPRIFWTLFPPDGKYTQAAVTHDYLYSVRGVYSQDRVPLSRKESDRVFYEGMRILRVPYWKRFIMWRAVRRFGWVPWKKK